MILWNSVHYICLFSSCFLCSQFFFLLWGGGLFPVVNIWRNILWEFLFICLLFVFKEGFCLFYFLHFCGFHSGVLLQWNKKRNKILIFKTKIHLPSFFSSSTWHWLSCIHLLHLWLHFIPTHSSSSFPNLSFVSHWPCFITYHRIHCIATNYISNTCIQ